MVNNLGFAALCCLISLGSARSDLLINLGEQWQENYASLFGPNKADTTDREVRREFMWLHDKLSEIEDEPSIDMEEKNNVATWYEFLTNEDTNNCNVKYLEKFSDYSRLNVENKKLERLYLLGHVQLIKICKRFFGDIGEFIENGLGLSSAKQLESILELYEQSITGDLNGKKLARHLWLQLGVSKTLKNSKLLDAWENSSCGKLKSLMDSPEMRSHRKLMQLVEFNQMSRLRYRDNQAGLDETLMWDDIINVCIAIDRIKNKLADYNSPATVYFRKMNVFS